MNETTTTDNLPEPQRLTYGVIRIGSIVCNIAGTPCWVVTDVRPDPAVGSPLTIVDTEPLPGAVNLDGQPLRSLTTEGLPATWTRGWLQGTPEHAAVVAAIGAAA